MRGKKFFVVLVLMAILLGFYSIGSVKEGLRFKKMVLDNAESIIKDAVEGIANSIKKFPKNLERFGLIYTVGYPTRAAVYKEEAKRQDPNSKSPYWHVLDFEFRYFKEIARRALNTPTGLKAVYLTLKPIVIKEFKRNRIEIKIVEELEWILPFFDGSLPEETLQRVNTRYLLAQNASYNLVWELEDEFKTEYGLLDKHFLTYEWVIRRKKEGGQALVDMYAWCIKDMLESL